MDTVSKDVSKSRAQRRQGLSRLPRKAPTRWRAGFPWHRLDWRSPDARFLGKFIGDVVSDHGGVDRLSRTQLHNIERAAFLALKVVQYECADLVPGSQPAPAWTPADYLGAVRQAQRLLNDLGPGRVAKDAPRLADYLRELSERPATPPAQAEQALSAAAEVATP